MKSYTEQLEQIKSNLALVEAVYARYPELFSGADSTALDRDIPQIRWWSSDTPIERRIAIATAFRDAGWTRYRSGSWVEWRAIISGIEFILDNMEPEERRYTDGKLGPVKFPPEPPTESADRKSVVDAMHDIPQLAGMQKGEA